MLLKKTKTLTKHNKHGTYSGQNQNHFSEKCFFNVFNKFDPYEETQ